MREKLVLYVPLQLRSYRTFRTKKGMGYKNSSSFFFQNPWKNLEELYLLVPKVLSNKPLHGVSNHPINFQNISKSPEKSI